MNNLTLGLLISVAIWMTPAPGYSYAHAVWYAPGVMEANCQYRADLEGISYDKYMDGAIDGAAMMSPSDLGKTVWIKRDVWEGPFRVCDAGTRGQVYEMVTWRGEVVEVGWKTAERWGMGPHDGGWKTDVEAWVGETPPDRLDLEPPVDYVEWFLKLVEAGPR